MPTGGFVADMSTNPVARKATLFCSSCSYAGPAEDEWVHRETVTGTAVVCPDCRTRVATHRLDSTPAFVDAIRAWNRAVLAPWRMWYDSVECVERP